MISNNAICFPTIRLGEMADTVAHYKQNLQRFGYNVPIVVFDDQHPDEFPDYEAHLAQLKETAKAVGGDIYYMGYQEKAAFKGVLGQGLTEGGCTNGAVVVDNIFRSPSYGANRNFILSSLVDWKLACVDDDMRPYEMWATDAEQVTNPDIVKKGHTTNLSQPLQSVIKSPYQEEDFIALAAQRGIYARPLDVAGVYFSVLGQRVGDLVAGDPAIRTGEVAIDPCANMLLNTTLGNFDDGSINDVPKELHGVLLLNPHDSDAKAKAILNSTVKYAQTRRVGTEDVDALDWANMVIDSDDDPTALTSIYVMDHLNPYIVNQNWSIDGSVTAIDNSNGTICPMMPTGLRMEDCFQRPYASKDGIASMTMHATHTHIRSTGNRQGMASNIVNEEYVTYFKEKFFRDFEPGNNTMHIGYNGQVTKDESRHVLNRMRAVSARMSNAASGLNASARQSTLQETSQKLDMLMHQYDPANFHKQMTNVIGSEYDRLKLCLSSWPEIVRIAKEKQDQIQLLDLAENKHVSVGELGKRDCYSDRFCFNPVSGVKVS